MSRWAIVFVVSIVFACSVGVHTASELRAIQERMESSQLKTYNLTESDLVKDHLRYLVCWPQKFPSLFFSTLFPTSKLSKNIDLGVLDFSDDSSSN